MHHQPGQRNKHQTLEKGQRRLLLGTWAARLRPGVAGLLSPEAFSSAHRLRLLPVLTWAPAVCVCVLISSSYEDTRQVGLAPTAGSTHDLVSNPHSPILWCGCQGFSI